MVVRFLSMLLLYTCKNPTRSDVVQQSHAMVSRGRMTDDQNSQEISVDHVTDAADR